MAIQQFQEFAPIGSRFLFRRDPIASVEQPYRDLGVVDDINPSFDVPKIELFDPQGGLPVLVDTAIQRIGEKYSVTCKNVSITNLSLSFLSNEPASFTQSATEKTVDHWLTPDGLFGIIDNDTAKTRVSGLATIIAVYTGTISQKSLVGSGAAIVAATKTITLSGDQTAVAGLAAGKVFFVNTTGLANKKNARSYTVATNTLNGGNTDLVVVESPTSDETGVTGTIQHENAGTIFKQDIDWDVYSIDRGFGRVKAGGAIAAAAVHKVVWASNAITGKRLVVPQGLKTVVQGDLEIWWARENFGRQSVRRCRANVTPGQPNFTSSEHASVGFEVDVISDLTLTEPAGRLIQVIGSLPSQA